jgi:hypothetical protein
MQVDAMGSDSTSSFRGDADDINQDNDLATLADKGLTIVLQIPLPRLAILHTSDRVRDLAMP